MNLFKYKKIDNEIVKRYYIDFIVIMLILNIYYIKLNEIVREYLTLIFKYFKDTYNITYSEYIKERINELKDSTTYIEISQKYKYDLNETIIEDLKNKFNDELYPLIIKELII